MRLTRPSIRGIQQEVLTFPVMKDEAGNDDQKNQLHAGICETANSGRTVGTDVAFGAPPMLKTVAETIKVRFESEESSAPPSASRLPQVFTADFVILHGNFLQLLRNESAFAQRRA